MTADPLEEKAEKIASPHADWLDQDDYDILKSDIISALHSVREQTLEEAAKVAEKEEYDPYTGESSDFIALKIRALKGKP